MKVNNDVLSHDGELSVSSLTPDLAELETQASEMLGEFLFLVAINALDSTDQLVAFLAPFNNVPEGEDCSHLITPSHESFYLLTIAQGLGGVRHKILYEYKRKTGSFRYKAGDKKPLLIRREIMRRLYVEERDAFVAFCKSIKDGTHDTSVYFREREEFVVEGKRYRESLESKAVEADKQPIV